jgi:hypothetical protein
MNTTYITLNREESQKLDEYAQIAYSSVETLKKTFSVCKERNQLNGFFVECGVGAGAQLLAMCLASNNQKVIGFDSFEGIPIATKEDKQQPGIGYFENENIYFKGREGELTSSGITKHNIESVDMILRANGFSNYQLVKGWFQNTLPIFENSKDRNFNILVLRLDADLYESTKVCFKHLFKFVDTKNGILIIDDYYTVEGAKLATDEFFELKKITPQIQQINNVAYIEMKNIKRNKK